MRDERRMACVCWGKTTSSTNIVAIMFWWPAILRLRRANRCVAGDDDCNVYTHCPQTKRPHTPPPGSMCTPHQTRIKCLFQIEIANVRIWQNCHHWHFQLFRFVYINAILCSTTRNQYHRCCWSWLPAAACLLLGNADFMRAFSEHASIK